MTTRKFKPYLPKKYFAGLSKTRKAVRTREIRKFGALGWRNPKAYVGFKTDVGIRTKASSYTNAWRKKGLGDAKSLAQKAKVTGVPRRFLQASYDRGMAAWRTGHRPGATQQQWGYARVHSLLLCGKTYHTTDSDLVRKAKAASASARKWWNKTCRR